MALQASPNPPSEGFPEPLMHKNRLQQYAQRSGLPLPCYFNSNEGSMHAPNFISTVFVSGVTYKSSRGFSHVKEAEQDAARVAYESILNKLKEEGIPDLHVGIIYSKNKLYAALQLVKDTPTVPVLTFPETSGQVVDVPAKIAPMPECKRPKLEPACEASSSNVSQNTTSTSLSFSFQLRSLMIPSRVNFL